MEESFFEAGAFEALTDADPERLCARLDVADVDAALRREEDLVVVSQRVDADVVLLILA